MSALAQKIREARKRLNLNQAQFAEAVGVSQGTVSKWENGEQRPDTDALLALARVSDTDAMSFWEEDEHDLQDHGWRNPIKVIGAIQAGIFVEAVEWSDYDKIDVNVPLPPEMGDYAVQGFLVRGDSMDQYYPDGSIVFALSTIANRVKPQHGDHVVVQKKDGTGMYEVTLKELVESNGQHWLMPRSSNPEFSQPVRIELDDTDDETGVVMVGIVVASYVIRDRSRWEKSK